ncbi:MAG: hypothetical protein E6K80_03735 [Candidatus Eisenbacteria bacterium]|uniref:Uncharacterized protein n=1 Tax=Eiseniibacteriota bacterium TaxID=2212470 RepID=A0A538U895_UNCEI|nr:MAG: hypothetical protein E6K80_03735 [Candidatus Eisenbacteria bacterium]
MGTPTRIVLRGAFPNGCGRKLGDQEEKLLVAISPNASCSPACPAVLTPWADTLSLGLLASGHYHLELELAVVNVCVAPPESTLYQVPFDFFVWTACAQDPIHYLDVVQIGPTDSSGVCAGDSIRVFLAGHFPDDCHRFRGARLVPSPIVGPEPEPDMVELLFDNLCCTDVICTPTPTPWSAEVHLPPLPARDYQLIVDAFTVCCRDSVLPGDPTGERLVPFVVNPAGSCGLAIRCLLPHFDHHARVGDCDTGFDGEGHAFLTMDLMTTVPLAGLQGQFVIYGENGMPGGLVVRDLTPVGPASGMHLTWSAQSGGAKFVLFSDAGAPIPAVAPGQEPPPVLRLELERVLTAGGSFAADSTRRWLVYADGLLGADEGGGGVLLCPVRAGERTLPDVGTVCVNGQCDLNRDGHSDVRDLVGMVRCLQGVGPCPPDSLGTPAARETPPGRSRAWR